MNARRLAMTLVAAILALTSLAVGLAAGADKPRAWLDQPLPGATLPFGPTPVTVHASDPGGIAKVSFLVDGLPAGELTPPAGDPVTVEWTWAPAVGGEHLLTVFARSNAGTYSAPASAVVTFVEIGPAASPAPTASPASTLARTTTPTQGPCLPPAPALGAPTNYYLVLDSGGGNPPTFRWGYRSTPACRAASFRVRVSAQSNLASPLYDQVIAAGGGLTWSWTPPRPFPFARTCTYYYWTVTARTSTGSAGGTAATWRFAVCP